MSWNTDHEVDLLKKLNGVVTEEGASKGLARIDSAIDACEVILSLAPETNGEVAVKAWASLEGFTGRDHTHLAISEGRREDPVPRRRRAAAQDHLLADLVGTGVGKGLLQRRLHQRPRTDPVAHADRPSAALSGSSVDARLRRGLLRLSAADRHQDRQAGDRPQAERQRLGGAELHHAAPEMGHPLHLYRQSADADAVARRADRLDQRDRRQGRRDRRQRLDRGLQHQRRAGGARGGLPARQAGHVHDVSCPGEDRERAGLRADRPARRHPQFGHPRRAQADAHDRRLRAAGLRLQLLRHGRLQPRRIRHRPQDVESRLARYADMQINPVRPVWRPQNENPRSNRHGAEPRQVHRVSHLQRHLQERVDQPRRHGIRVVQQRRDQAGHRLSEGLGKPGALEGRLEAQAQRQDRAADRRQVAGAGEHLRQSGSARDRRLLRAVHVRLRASAAGAGNVGDADRAARAR